MLEIRNANLGDKTATIVIDQEGGRIIEIKPAGKHDPNARFIEAKDLLVLPGLIDPHVHFRVPGGEHKETWETGSQAAIYGGVTTVFDMPNTSPALITNESLEEKLSLVGKPEIDYRFWFGATTDNAREIKMVCKHPKIIGVKVYMGSSTGNLLVSGEDDIRKVFETCVDNNLIVAVHAEDEELMKKNKSKFEVPQVSDHCKIRNTEVEVSAVKTALRLQEQTKAKLYFCHISTPESLYMIYDAKQKGAEIYAEVCPHHLYFTDLKLNDSRGAYYKMNPPLRTARQVNLMRDLLIRNDYIDSIGTDHAPHIGLEKDQRDYDDIPSGVPGLDFLVSLMFNWVQNDVITLTKFKNITSGNIARLFNLNKGKIKPGYDADLVLIEPSYSVRIEDKNVRSKCGWTPYNDISCYGIPKFTICGGKLHKLD